MELLENQPFDFIMNHETSDLDLHHQFVHRTFNGVDFVYFLQALKHIYKTYDSLENLFVTESPTLQLAISEFKSKFFDLPHLIRTTKHVSDPAKGSAAKRINMFLRWMVRSADKGVDFGLWTKISPSQLSCPLDVHSGRVARSLKLIKKK